MKNNVYPFPVPASHRPERPTLQREKIVYIPDYLERERRQPFFTWERTPGVPRRLENLSICVELLSTLVMTVFSLYWMWYAMCVMV